jgi:hypothetical protein
MAMEPHNKVDSETINYAYRGRACGARVGYSAAQVSVLLKYAHTGSHDETRSQT